MVFSYAGKKQGRKQCRGVIISRGNEIKEGSEARKETSRRKEKWKRMRGRKEVKEKSRKEGKVWMIEGYEGRERGSK